VDKRGGGEVANLTGHPVGAVKGHVASLVFLVFLITKTAHGFQKKLQLDERLGLGVRGC